MPKFEQNSKRRSPHVQPDALKPIQIDETILSTSGAQIRDTVDTRLTDSLVTVLEKMEALGLINPEQSLEDEDNDLDLESFEDNLREILGSQISAAPKKQLNCYLKYLKRNIKEPCYLTGVEEFEWEEKYLFGAGRQSQYEKLKENNPSYSDIFVLVRFLDRIHPQDGIQVEVQRTSDRKTFTLSLIELEGSDPESPNYQLIEDYSLWFLNYFSN